MLAALLAQQSTVRARAPAAVKGENAPETSWTTTAHSPAYEMQMLRGGAVRTRSTM